MNHAPRDRQVSGSAEPSRDVGAQPRGLRVPDPVFSAKVHSGRRPSRPGWPSVQLRWARCPDDGRLHLLQPVDVTLAAASGQAPALCGYRIPAQGLAITRVPSETQLSGTQASALCMACVIGAAASPKAV